MGDSACLVQGFPYASALPDESKQGNAMYGLTDSVSFGRFMTESLCWERWSTFTHRKYVEEAERYAQPGSVAQKKAFFEAHYKGLAAKKAAVVYDLKIQDSTSIVVGNAEAPDYKISVTPPLENTETPKMSNNNMLENSVSKEDDGTALSKKRFGSSTIQVKQEEVPPALAIPVAPQENDATESGGDLVTTEKVPCGTERRELAHSSSTAPKNRDLEQPSKGASGCRIPSPTRSQNERKKTPVDCISTTSGHERHALSAVFSESSPTNANTPQSPILSTPSAERKQEVEEKISSNEVKKMQLRKTRKEKTGKRFGILGCGFCFRPRFDFEEETDIIQDL